METALTDKSRELMTFIVGPPQSELQRLHKLTAKLSDATDIFSVYVETNYWQMAVFSILHHTMLTFTSVSDSNSKQPWFQKHVSCSGDN